MLEYGVWMYGVRNRFWFWDRFWLRNRF